MKDDEGVLKALKDFYKKEHVLSRERNFNFAVNKNAFCLKEYLGMPILCITLCENSWNETK